MDTHTVLSSIQSDTENSFYTKTLLWIPKNEKEGLAIFPYPESGEIKSWEVSWLLKEGEIDPAWKKRFWGSKEPNLHEEYFSAYGWKFKVISYYKRLKSSKGNKRLNNIYRSWESILTQVGKGEAFRQSIFAGEKNVESNETKICINQNVVLVCQENYWPSFPM